MQDTEAGTIRTMDLADVPAEDWDQLVGTDQPAMQHGFLRLLESSGAASPETGWIPRHLGLDDAQGRLNAALPLYEKSHSFGEFVFDFALADAWHRNGLAYYPKLVSAIPFSPLVGPRIPARDSQQQERLIAALEAETGQRSCSTAHALFCREDEAKAMQARHWIRREGCRFQWHNRGYTSFDDWLGRFRAKKRKNLRRERRTVRDAGIRFTWQDGDAVRDLDWDEYYPLYAATYWRRGQTPYLPKSFFVQLCQQQSDSVVLIEGRDRNGELLALAFCLRGERTLYGRHWGCTRELDGLHFETCYHQGIEYCIANGLDYFDPGTQGEHKLLRGFEPVTTCSMHWIPDPRFHAAVSRFAEEERAHNAAYMASARAHLPFHREQALGP
ncbi:putative N-acyltransferase [Natronospira proteinivora]|uniref:N-acyltransferase n=1 Tax=Natronospira proteinivora TaxID=1807133 RepID=A0ABT1G610_9GAMM|nr:GNAT family N-acetyltransferase [Natronospira proteinivora]MCP1726731.1 putative N-acyltransferase [Natronospira proteinivora]